MASSAPPSSSATGVKNPKRSLGLMKNAMKYKESYIQFFVMTGFLLFSLRSLGQKYHLRNLEEDTAALRKEQEELTERMNNIKSSLLHEASLDKTGRFASRLRRLFGEEN